jgi:ATP-dependent helicase/nuclease subunit A
VVALVESLRDTEPDASIAILVRSRSHLGQVTADLVARGHAVSAREIQALGALPCIADLFALTRALLHEADGIAWLAVLRAPWCGLTLASLQHLTSRAGTILEALDDADLCAGLAADEYLRLARTAAVLRAALSCVGCEPLAPLIERSWIALGGPALLDNEARLDDVRVYFDLIAGLDEGLPAFGIERIAQQLASRYVSPPAASDTRLQVMTIHRAKGLEFDHVIVPGCGRQPRADGRALLAWREHRDPNGVTDLLLAPSPAKGDSPWFDYLSARDKEDSAAEAVRLLYVALTRARREVHLFGHVTQKDDGPPKAAKGSLFGMLWPAIGAAASAKLEPLQSVAIASSGQHTGPLLRRCDPATLPQQGILRALPSADLPLEFDWAGTTAKHIGTVAHRVLQDLMVTGVSPGWTPALAAFARGQLRALGVGRAELEAAVGEIELAVEATLRSPRGRWLFSSALFETESELCLAVVEQDQTTRVFIDRTFVDEHARRWIVDFKTGSHRGGAREAYLDSELTRYRPQLERYGRIMAGLDTRPIMLGLYFPLLDGWREWPLPVSS